MKEIIFYWFVAQCILLTFIGIDIHNRIIDKSYKCAPNIFINPLWSFAFPLVVFAPKTDELKTYCNY